VIHVLTGVLSEQAREGIVRPIRSDLAPLTHAARDLIAAAGPSVEERLEQLGSLPLGSAVITPAGALPASFIIHIVTASEEDPETPHSVQRALRNGLRRAADWGLTSLAMPPLGVGAGQLDPEDAARAQLEILVDHLDEGAPPLDLTIVVAGAYEAEIFTRLADELTRARFPLRS
jgi:O-acetyl-ADP-ribose deacetylase (regulator of RNase III)